MEKGAFGGTASRCSMRNGFRLKFPAGTALIELLRCFTIGNAKQKKRLEREHVPFLVAERQTSDELLLL